MARVQDVRKSSLTFAPEAGSQRLRDVINKGITEEEILNGAREAFRGGWSKVKLYFMLGLPTETEEDRVAISDLANKISAAYYEEVPKEKRATVNHAIYAAHNHRSIRYSWHDSRMIFLEGILARGDRRTADLIQEAYRLGAVFDCWLDTWDYARWEQAAANIGMDVDFYALRERTKDEILPWDFIDAGVRRDFLWKEWEKAHAAVLTPNCREACSGCGAAEYGCGVCLRKKASDRIEEKESAEKGSEKAAELSAEAAEKLAELHSEAAEESAELHTGEPEEAAEAAHQLVPREARRREAGVLRVPGQGHGRDRVHHFPRDHRQVGTSGYRCFR